MPTGNEGSDTTESEFPSDGTNPFKGKSPSPTETNGQLDEGSQRAEQADTTAGDTGAEPAEGAQDTPDPEAQPTVGETADTTAEEPTQGEEPRAESEEGAPEEDVSEEDAPTGTQDDSEPSAEDAPEDGTDEEMDVPFKYHGTEPEEEKYEDYVFISEVDPDQRYEDVESFVNAHENLLQHSERKHEQVQSLQEQLADARAEQEGEVAEMRAKLNLYEEKLGTDQVTEALAERHMPEKFQGLSEEDVPADQQKEFLRAKWEAERKAEGELEEAEEKRTRAQEQAQKRQKRVQERIQQANEFLEGVDHERLGLGQEEAERYATEALSELTPEDAEVNHFDLAHQMLVMPELLPDEVDFGEREAQLAAEGLIDAVGAKAKELKREEMQSRTDKIQRKQSRSRSRADNPEPATQESARREPGQDPKKTFRNAG
jgi:hypothetical protein